MITLQNEHRSLKFDFVDALNAFSFDDDKSRLSHYNLSAVDFIAEYHDRYEFIEIKDPNQHRAQPIRDINDLVGKLAKKF